MDIGNTMCCSAFFKFGVSRNALALSETIIRSEDGHKL